MGRPPRHRFSFGIGALADRGRALGALAPALLLLSLSVASAGCFDPTLALPEDETDVINSPPLIDESSVFPLPKTTPEAVFIGTNCSADFSIGSVLDADLEESFIYRWRLIAQVDVGQELTQRLKEDVLVNDPDEPLATLPGPLLQLDYAMLFGKYGTQVDDMTGRTHRLEFHITDADFVPGSDTEVEVGGGRDSFYWLIDLVGDDC